MTDCENGIGAEKCKQENSRKLTDLEEFKKIKRS